MWTMPKKIPPIYFPSLYPHYCDIYETDDCVDLFVVSLRRQPFAVVVSARVRCIVAVIEWIVVSDIYRRPHTVEVCTY